MVVATLKMFFKGLGLKKSLSIPGKAFLFLSSDHPGYFYSFSFTVPEHFRA